MLTIRGAGIFARSITRSVNARKTEMNKDVFAGLTSSVVAGKGTEKMVADGESAIRTRFVTHQRKDNAA